MTGMAKYVGNCRAEKTNLSDKYIIYIQADRIFKLLYVYHQIDFRLEIVFSLLC